MLTGAPPFANRKKSEVAFNVAIEGKRPPRPNNSENLGITNDIWKLLELCWSKSPSSRPEVSRVAGHLKGAVKHWRADATSFLLASEAGVQEVMGMEPEKAQKIADDIDKVGSHRPRTDRVLTGVPGPRPRRSQQKHKEVPSMLAEVVCCFRNSPPIVCPCRGTKGAC